MLEQLFSSATSSRFPFHPFDRYIDLLLKWNQKISLTSLKDPLRILDELVLDSLQIETEISPEARLADIGSGGGCPGIPLKLAIPDLTTVLFESIKKKADFLKEVVRSLALKDIDVVNQRVTRETDLSSFDLIVSRGTLSISDFLRLIERKSKFEVRVILFKGDDPDDEVKKLSDDSSLQWALEKKKVYELPISKKRRSYLIFKKIK